MTSTLKKAKSKSKLHKPIAPGPRTVRAWFDTVINPLLKALERENSLLLRSDWTWRFRLGVLEEIRPVRNYISPETRENLDQFLDCYQKVRAEIDRHDQATGSLEDACHRLHHVLVTRDYLPRLYEEVTTLDTLRSIWQQSRYRGISRDDLTRDQFLAEYFGGYPPSDHIAVLAQYIINNTGELPEHYTTAPFWNRYGEKFKQIMQVPVVRAEFGRASAASTQLRKTSNALSVSLQQIRLELSINHDVPYVDPTATRHSGQTWHT